MNHRVIVCGGREFHDQNAVDAALDELWLEATSLVVIHGGAQGADACANAWVYAKRAKGFLVGLMRFPAAWRKHGRSAGPIRNREMLVQGRPTLVLAFPGGAGTANMVALAEEHGVTVRRASACPGSRASRSTQPGPPRTP